MNENDALVVNDDRCAFGKTVVRIVSNRLGTGDDRLGKILLESSLLCLTEVELLPHTVIFMNAGVELAAGSGPLLEVVQRLADAGVRIMVCDTCLEYYGLTEQLSVGGLANIYQITKTLLEADKVIDLA